LEEDWDYVCIVPPYYSVGQDPKLAGVEIPWTWHEGLYTVVLKREDPYDIHPISRGKVVWFRLIGINEEAACYETTAVSIEYVEGDGPVTLRVTPED